MGRKWPKPVLLLNLALIAIASFPLFRVHWNSYTILLLGLYGLWFSLSNEKRRVVFKERLSSNVKLFIISTLFIFPVLLSLTYSQNIGAGIKNILHILPVVVFPLLFCFLLPKVRTPQLRWALYSFLAACVVQVLAMHFQFYGLGLYDNFQQATFYRLPFREAVFNFEYQTLHPSYISLWYCFAICVALKIIYDCRSMAVRILCLLSVILLLYTIVILSSRIGFLCLLGLSVYCLTLIRNRKVMMFLGLGFLLIFILSITKISFISSRIITEFQQTELSPPVGKKHNSINIRVGIYQCAFEIASSNFLLGVGFGDVQDELDSCYTQFDTDVYQSDNYNSHSYFLHILLSGGVIALVFLLYMLFFFWRTATRNGAYLYICFMLIIILGMLFENTLSRSHGVFFFAFFNSLFLSYYRINSANHAYSGHSTLS